MAYKSTFSILMLLFFIFTTCGSAWSTLVIHSQKDVKIELTGFNGLSDSTIFTGNLVAGGKHEIQTGYRGLALLIFTNGQRYPIIIGDESFVLNIADSTNTPSFIGSAENEFFYRLLAGGEPFSKNFSFAHLMIQAKQLLESTQFIQSPKELNAKKKEFHEFVRKYFEDLKRSDMLRRLVGQYFMMHEYVDYHTKGFPATDILQKYQQAVLSGVGRWLESLKTYIPEHVVLNYCVSLYYNRSMVTLASMIINNYPEFAYCPGVEPKKINFPSELIVSETTRNREMRLGEFKNTKIIAFVSDECPVSMVETISKARELSDSKDVTLIVAPLQTLSKNHLSMDRMISSGDFFFVNDEQWRKNNLPDKMKLPLFIRIESAIE